MKNFDENHGWEQLRNLPPELELDAVLKHIQSFPANPPTRRWKDSITFKTKWIMLLSALSIFVLVFNFWSTDELVRRDATAGAGSSTERDADEVDHDPARRTNQALRSASADGVAMLELEPEPDFPETDDTMAAKDRSSASNELVRRNATPGAGSSAERDADEVDHDPARRTNQALRSASADELVDSLAPQELPVMLLTNTATLLTKKENNLTPTAPAQKQGGAVTQMHSADPPLGEPVQTGKWYFVRDMDGHPFIRYRWKEKFPASKATWDLVQPLSDLVDDSYAQRMPEKFKNAVGTVYFHGSTDKDQGEFEFYLNLENADRLNAAGAGPRGVDEKALSMSGWTQGLGKERFAQHPKDVLWFRYFLEDVDNATFDLLAQYGYEGEDLHDFWQLINRGVNKVELSKYLPLLEKVYAGKVAFSELPQLLTSEVFTRNLLALERNGYRHLAEEEFNKFIRTQEVGRFLNRLADLGYTSQSYQDVMNARTGLVELNALKKLLTNFEERPSLNKLIEAFENKYRESVYVGKIIASPRNWGTSCVEVGRYDQDLPPFSRAVIKGNIRVVIRKGKANTMTTLAYSGKERLVTAEVKNNILYLTGPKGENRSWNYDIQLTATDLTKVKAKTKTCVWLDGERALREIEGKLCPTRNFEKWVE